MENESSVRGTEVTMPEYAKGWKISLNSGSFGSAQMSGKQELPPFETLRDKCDRVGHLKKLCGRGLLSAGTWKDRTCVLYQNQLFLYEKQDTEKESSTGIVLDLGSLDSVREAPTRVTRKAANVFLLGSTDRGFFDTTSSRHYFAAKTLSEMKEWVSVITACMESERKRRKESATFQPPSSLGNHYSHKDLTSEQSSMATGTMPRNSSLETQLDCGVSKSRAKGPPGRRLPRSKKSIDALLDESQVGESPLLQFRDTRGRTTSLSALEYSPDVAVDLRPEPRLSQVMLPGGASPSEMTNSNPNISFDFEHAWFFKLPTEPTSDYSSLHDDTTSGDVSPDHRNSRHSTPVIPRDPSKRISRKESSRTSRPLSVTNRSACRLL